MLGGKSLVPPPAIPLLAEVSPPWLLTTQGQVPRRKGLVPSQPCQAQCKGESCRLQITVPGGCSHASCC